jgi:hypothetical protein
MMLQQFSWQQFLVVLSGLTLLWYVVVILIFYRQKFSDWFKGSRWQRKDGSWLLQGQGSPSLPHRWHRGVEDISEADGRESAEPDDKDSLMGESRLPEGMSSVSMDQLSFSSAGQGAAWRDVEDQQGLVPDVLQDIKEVLGILAKEDGSKQDFFRLMETVRLSYPGLSAHPALRRINEFITDHASFHISADELDDLWN